MESMDSEKDWVREVDSKGRVWVIPSLFSPHEAVYHEIRYDFHMLIFLDIDVFPNLHHLLTNHLIQVIAYG